jgi:hypothetical protein
MNLLREKQPCCIVRHAGPTIRVGWIDDLPPLILNSPVTLFVSCRRTMLGRQRTSWQKRLRPRPESMRRTSSEEGKASPWLCVAFQQIAIAVQAIASSLLVLWSSLAALLILVYLVWYINADNASSEMLRSHCSKVRHPYYGA